ncbi:MAG: hypothetical protein FWJ93_14235 [Micromonosporaceae bacterium]
MAPVPVYVEIGKKRVFACSVDWPGWCRSGKNVEAALEALAAYAPRYRVVAEQAEVAFPARAGDAFDVVERVPGDGTTDFGAPGRVPACDARPLTPRRAARDAALVGAAWAVFDRVASAAPAQLRKGPRGGGRDRDEIVRHVLAAEAAYARKLGIRHRAPDPADTAAVAGLREATGAVLRTATAGEPVVAKGWPPRYAARRIAWHVLDHAWEIEDRG